MATILIAEDDDIVRRLLLRLLTRLGHVVIETCNGQEALDVVVGGAVVDLVITDIDMPILDGLGLVRALAKQWPALPVLISSGSRSRVAGVPLLPKPFTPDGLRAAVDALLAPKP